jgi:hypothetical protein
MLASIVGRRRRLPVVAIGLLLAAAAMGDARPGAPSRAATFVGVPQFGYVGKVDGTRAYVGIIARGHAVTAYVCDGRTLARWFNGSVRGTHASLRSSSGGRIEVDLADGARGVLTIPGRKDASFAAVAARGRAGLFRAERSVTGSGKPGRVLSGWVRLNDGSVRGASLINSFRVLRPSPGVVALLQAEGEAQVVPAPGVPNLATRQTTVIVPVCRQIGGVTGSGTRVALTTTGCGLPLALSKPAGSGPAIRLRPRDFRLTSAALAKFAAGLDGFLTKREKTAFKLAGQAEPRRFSQTDSEKIDSTASAMVRDSKVLDAAARLRSAATAELAARTGDYLRAGRAYTTPVENLPDDGSPLVAVYTVGGTPGPLPRILRTYFGPWAEVSNLESHGDQWETSDSSVTICHDFIACTPLFSVLGTATTLQAQARAGFNSSVTYQKADLLTFDIPANAGEVEVGVTTGVDRADVDTENCFGIASGRASWSWTIFRVGSDGAVDPFNDDPVTGVWSASVFDEDDGSLSPDDCVPSLAPPVPDPPEFDVLATGPLVLTFTAPPEGGTYALAVTAEAHAEVALGGTAIAQVTVGVDKVTVSHH